MKKAIALMNRKGGVLKSSVSVGLAHGLALKGHKVLLIDLDPQANAGTMLGIPAAEEGTFDDVYNRRPVTPVYARENLDIIPGGDALAELNVQIGASSRDAGEEAQRALAEAEKEYDYIILDTAPSISPMNRMVAQYATDILVPVSPSVLAADGLAKLEDEMAKMELPEVDGIIPTLVDKRTRLGKRIVDDLNAAYPGKILPSVPTLALAAEIPYDGKTVFESAECRPVADAIMEVLEEII